MYIKNLLPNKYKFDFQGKHYEFDANQTLELDDQLANDIHDKFPAIFFITEDQSKADADFIVGKENDSLIQENATLTAEITTLKKEISQLKSKNTKSDNKIKQLQEELKHDDTGQENDHQEQG